MPHSYDTNFLIRKVLVNSKIFEQVKNELLNENSGCIILMSIQEELVEKLIYISSRLQKFREETRKYNFEIILNSSHYIAFKERYSEIANDLENNCHNTNFEHFNVLLQRIQELHLALQNFFPTTEENYEKIKKGEEYKQLIEKSSNDDSPHLALLEIYGKQRNEKIKFISCDEGDIVGKRAKEKISKNYQFIDPINGEDYISRF